MVYEEIISKWIVDHGIYGNNFDVDPWNWSVVE
jgi:hypothetical protein